MLERFLADDVDAQVAISVLCDADDEGWTPLLSASAGGHVEVVKILLRSGADASATTKRGRTPLHYHRGREAVAKALLDHMKEIDAEDADGVTPLMRAAAVGSAAVAALLLGKGASVSKVDAMGNTALHFACEGAHKDVSLLLLNHGASETAKNKEGRVPSALLPK